MTRKEKLRALSKELWARTKTDWVLSVHHIITEPVCPSACLYQEDKPDDLRFRADRDTIEEAIDAAIDMAYRFWVLGDSADEVQEFPVTNRGFDEKRPKKIKDN